MLQLRSFRVSSSDVYGPAFIAFNLVAFACASDVGVSNERVADRMPAERIARP